MFSTSSTPNKLINSNNSNTLNNSLSAKSTDNLLLEGSLFRRFNEMTVNGETPLSTSCSKRKIQGNHIRSSCQRNLRRDSRNKDSGFLSSTMIDPQGTDNGLEFDSTIFSSQGPSGDLKENTSSSEQSPQSNKHIIANLQEEFCKPTTLRHLSKRPENSNFVYNNSSSLQTKSEKEIDNLSEEEWGKLEGLLHLWAKVKFDLENRTGKSPDEKQIEHIKEVQKHFDRGLNSVAFVVSFDSVYFGIM